MTALASLTSAEMPAHQHWLHETKPLQLTGHSGRVFDVAFCPVYSGVLVSGSDDNSVKLWQIDDTESQVAGRETGTFSGHTDSVLRVSWQSDGQLFATGSADTTVRLWRTSAVSATSETKLQDATTIQTLQGHPEEVYACEFLPENRLLSASADKLYLWDLETGTQLQESQQSQHSSSANSNMPARWQSGSLFSAKPQPGGSLIATACSDGVVRVWDLRAGQLAHSLSIPVHNGMMAACAWDPNGYCIASVATAGDMSALDIRRQQKLWSGKAGCPLRDCCYLPNNVDRLDCLVAAGTDGSLYTCSHLENQGSTARLRATKAQSQSLLCVNSSEDGTVIAAAGGATAGSFPINVYSQGPIICV